MQQPDTGTAAETSKPGRRRRFLRPKPIIWTLVGVLAFCIVVMGVSAFVAKSSVDKLMAEARELSASINDPAAMADRADAMRGAAQTAHFATAHPIWRATEVLPFVGDDLRAVRVLAGTADDLMTNVAEPLLGFDFSAIGPTDGALNVDAVAQLGKQIEQVAPDAQRAEIQLIAEGIEVDNLLGPLQGPVTQVQDGLRQVSDALGRMATLSPRLPAMLGADEPRDYLVLVQNTAEMRTLGGNPGNMLMLTLDQGRMEITQQASRFDVNTRRDAPIVPLNPSTEELYTDRVGKFIQDVTMTPDFAQTAHLARAFWSETLGDPGDAVLAIDPVLLSYILDATGPVQLSTGEQLTGDNVVDELLSNVYWRFPGETEESARQQDQFFALAAGSIFGRVTNSTGNFASLLSSLYEGYDEGRILFASTDPTEAKAVEGTLFNGPLHDRSNTSAMTLGVFVNDNTEGKLDYYTDMSVDVSGDLCSAPDGESSTVTVGATYNYHLQPDEVASLPTYVSTGTYFPRGVKSTNLVFYGPVGSSFVSAKVDGQDFVPQAGTNDLGRQAVLINFESAPASTHDVEVTFSAPAGEHGPVDVRTTPMIKDVPTTIDVGGCGSR